MKTIAIALNSFRDAIRQKILILFMLIAFGLVILSRFVLGLNIGSGQMNFVADFGMGALSFFGVIIAVVSTCQLMHSEYDNKSVFLILSKAVSPLHFVGGKFLGIAMLMFIYCLGISLLTIALLYYTQGTLEHIPEAFLRDGRLELNVVGFLTYAFLQFLKLCIVSALSLLVCCVSKAIMFSIVISFCLYIISILTSSAIVKASDALSYKLSSYIFPDLDLFDTAKSFIFAPVDPTLFLYVLGYALVYILILISLSAFVFSRREY